MPIAVSVVTPEGQAFKDQAESVVLPGSEGEFGVLPGHEPFLTALRIGGMTIRKTGGEELHAAASQGFAEVHDDEGAVMVGTREVAPGRDRPGPADGRERRQEAHHDMPAR